MGNAKHTAVALAAVAMISSLAVKQAYDFKVSNRLAAILSSGNETTVSRAVITVSAEEAAEQLNESYTQEELQSVIDKKSGLQTSYVKLGGGVLNVYDSPSSECAPVDALNKLEEVSIVESTDGWYKITYNGGKEGYVSKANVTESKAEAEYAAMHFDNYETAKIKTNGDDINIRSKASKSSSILGQLKNGTSIVLLYEDGEFTKVCYGADYDTGFIATSYIERTNQWVAKADVANVQQAAAERRAAEQAAKEKAAKEAAAKAAAAKKATTTVTSKDGGTYTAPASSSKGQAIVNNVKKYLGVRYVYGGTSPKGFDCSGLVQYVCKSVGISVNRTAAAQFSNGKAVNKRDLQPGDLVFFAKGGRIHHVGVYVGNGQMIHAPRTGDVVRYASITSGYYKNCYAGARRVY